MTDYSPHITRLDRLRDLLQISPLALLSSVVLFVLLVDNSTFWRIGTEVFSGQPLALAAMIGALYCLTLALFSLFALPWLVKPFSIFVLILSSVTGYYMDTLGAFIDREMIQNVMVTTITESKHLITLGFILHVALYGLLPSAVVLALRLKPQRRLVAFGAPVLAGVLCFLITIGLLATNFKTYASILRERKDFLASYQPGAPIVNSFRYAAMMSKTLNITVQPLGEDAIKGTAYNGANQPVLTVLVVGETARAQNFGLNGYARDTTPNLAALPIVNFETVSSCGTSTAVSLPCMFSKLPRKDYSFEAGAAAQNLLDVMAHAGLHVEWWDNNTGHKGLADRLPNQNFLGKDIPVFCRQGECDDGVFLPELRAYAESLTKDTVLVLHQIGSHGPSYFMRYPPEFEKFTPACQTPELKKCTADEVTNAYDNTIAFTDQVLAETIDVLSSLDGLTTAMFYVSDHGESLGEGGLYLHGAPYFMASKEQTHVPMLLWMSDRFATQFGHDRECLNNSRAAALSHDNLFHSLLGMMDITTDVYDRKLDLFAPCTANNRKS
ncbi:phosphoethanolamine transferase [Lentibacter sp.]|uniref:phosphoethanolamine transferase n=1 Tax=Lentibacter sp. TaxID=2024994 RepID=UPI003F6A2B17